MVDWYNASGQNTAETTYYNDDSYVAITYNLSGGSLNYTQNNYSTSGQLLWSAQYNIDGSSIETSYDVTGGTWTSMVEWYNASRQNTAENTYYNDGSYVAITYNLSGGLLNYTENDYIASGQLAYSVQYNTDGSSVATDYDLSGGSWVKGVYCYDASGNLTVENVIYNDGSEVITAGTVNATLNGGSGYNIYEIGSIFGQDSLNNNGGSAAHGEVDFLGATNEQLWFKKSGNNLLIDLLGTNDSVTITNWYNGTAGNQVQTFDSSNGLKLDGQVAQLVSAMATYAANNSGFNPTTATAMPTNTTLQNTIAAAWHT